MLITFLKSHWNHKLEKNNGNSIFILGQKTGVFVTFFSRKGYVFLLINAKEEFQVYTEIYGLWLCVFVSEQNPGSLPCEGFQ